MYLRTGIFTVAACLACLCATQSTSNAQILQRGNSQLAARAARAVVVRAVPGAGIASFAARGIRNNGIGQGFRVGNQGFGTQRFGNQGFGTQVFGNQGFGTQTFGNQGFGNQVFGNQGFGVRNGLQGARLFRGF